MTGIYDLSGVNLLDETRHLDDIRSDRLLIWHDEFDKSEIDTNKWSNIYGFYSNKCWCAPDMMRNIASGGGMSYWCAKDYPKDYTDYSGAYIHTNGKFEFQYGLIEAKMRFPSASPHHTTFWTLGACGLAKSTGEDTAQEGVGVKWPGRGEIDIAECDNGTPGARVHYSNLGFDDNTDNRIRGNVALLTNTPTDWHIYSCEWTDSAITFYVDGVQKGTWSTSEATVNGWNPFKIPHYIVLNCIPALSGTISWDIAKTDVAWVRVYAPQSVTEYIKETALTFDATASITVGERKYLYPVFTPMVPSDMTLTWSSSNESVATCYGGMIVGVGAGTAFITAKTKHGCTAFCKVTVS